MTLGTKGRFVLAAFCTGVAAATAAWLDSRYQWITPAFDAVAHLFYESPRLSEIRRPSQLVLVRWHLASAQASWCSACWLQPD